MLLKSNRTSTVTHYRKFVFTNYHRSGFRTSLERKAWPTYKEQLTRIKYRRSPANLPNPWNDYYASAKLQHPLSWKSHYKCSKQWMKNLP